MRRMVEEASSSSSWERIGRPQGKAGNQPKGGLGIKTMSFLDLLAYERTI